MSIESGRRSRTRLMDMPCFERLKGCSQNFRSRTTSFVSRMRLNVLWLGIKRRKWPRKYLDSGMTIVAWFNLLTIDSSSLCEAHCCRIISDIWRHQESWFVREGNCEGSDVDVRTQYDNSFIWRTFIKKFVERHCAFPREMIIRIRRSDEDPERQHGWSSKSFPMLIETFSMHDVIEEVIWFSIRRKRDLHVKW